MTSFYYARDKVAINAIIRDVPGYIKKSDAILQNYAVWLADIDLCQVKYF